MTTFASDDDDDALCDDIGVKKRESDDDLVSSLLDSTFFSVVREREREKKAVFAPRATKTRKTTKGIIGFIIPGKEGDLSKRSKDLSLRLYNAPAILRE